ncbi:MAG: serine protease [Candidatus Gracilibacteria bacterium]|nr:serine protease [Candidatus Gracilibacteria bacterium]
MKKFKYITFLILIIIGGIYFIKILNMDKNINIDHIINSIVIIIPENKLESYKNNPNGIFQEYKESGIGAGFFIDSNGTIQTVNHIVEDDKIKYKVIYKNQEYNSEIISRNKEKDLAKLKINSKIKFPTISNYNNDYLNGEFYSFGVDTKKLEIIYNTGVILDKKSKLDNMSNLLEISNQLKPGFSGGPIIDSKGNVIGINYAISEGKNYGIIY